MRKQVVKYWHNGSIHWYFDGKYHRDRDLPARFVFKNKKLWFVSYYKDDEYHRTNGPAIIDYQSKYKEYQYEGTPYASLEEMRMVKACR